MFQFLLNLFKGKKKEIVEPAVEPVPLPSPPEEIKVEVNSQITDAVTQVEKPAKSKRPRQSKKK